MCPFLDKVHGFGEFLETFQDFWMGFTQNLEKVQGLGTDPRVCVGQTQDFNRKSFPKYPLGAFLEGPLDQEDQEGPEDQQDQLE